MDTMLAVLCFILNIIARGGSWLYFSNVADMPKHTYLTPMLHSRYTFGDCEHPNIRLQTHVHLDGIDILGKIFSRGWLDVQRIPTCIIMNGYSQEQDMFRYTSERFQICVPRITYCHTHKRYKYFYYEWHLPYHFKGGMDWEIYFYGPTGTTW